MLIKKSALTALVLAGVLPEGWIKDMDGKRLYVVINNLGCAQ